jgi:hypothetical protein
VVLEGFKCFKDEFRLTIPPPEAEGDLDVIVLGGDNGSGKTSVLEGILFGLLCHSALPILPTTDRIGSLLGTVTSEPADRLSRAVVALRNVESANFRISLSVKESGAEQKVVVSSAHDHYPSDIQVHHPRGRSAAAEAMPSPSQWDAWLLEACDLVLWHGSEPLVASPVLYLHSYREVAMRDPLIEEVLDYGSGGDGKPRGSVAPLSRFKLDAIEAVLGSKGAVEGLDPEASQADLDALSGLLSAFVSGARIHEQVNRGGAGHSGLLVTPADGSTRLPFNFLSSGQKEIISTLFLIWEYTRDCPSVVLIDEPELHLHPQWHDDFMHELHALAPYNQYIIATHSERIAESVPPGRVLWIER